MNLRHGIGVGDVGHAGAAIAPIFSVCPAGKRWAVTAYLGADNSEKFTPSLASGFCQRAD